jgi:hypothetical protein
MAEKKELKVGFDLDGVILYNPARIIRPIMHTIKSSIFKKKKVSFYVPKTKLEEFIWYLAHKSSFITAPGLDELKDALSENKFKAYIVTARFHSLRHDFLGWMKRINADQYFAGYFHNQEDEQPHIFKKKMIEKLNLDVFVDDNWDIVQYLKKEFAGTDKQIYWIYNLFDKNKEHELKFPHLKQAVEHILETHK